MSQWDSDFYHPIRSLITFASLVNKCVNLTFAPPGLAEVTRSIDEVSAHVIYRLT